MLVPRNVLPVELASCAFSAIAIESAVVGVVPRPAVVTLFWVCFLVCGVLKGIAGFETPVGDIPLPPVMEAATEVLVLRDSLSSIGSPRCNRDTLSRSLLSSRSLAEYSPLPPVGFPSLRSRAFITNPAARVPPTLVPPTTRLGPASLADTPFREVGRAFEGPAMARW